MLTDIKRQVVDENMKKYNEGDVNYSIMRKLRQYFAKEAVINNGTDRGGKDFGKGTEIFMPHLMQFKNVHTPNIFFLILHFHPLFVEKSIKA